MASTDSTDLNVTISRAYLETLLRRGGFKSQPDVHVTPLDLTTVTIPKSDHDDLLRLAQEYAALRDALLCGGITNEALEVLIRGGGSDPLPGSQLNDTNEISGPAFDYQPQGATAGFAEPLFDQPSSYSAGNWQSRNTFRGGLTRGTHPRFDRQLSSNHDDTSFFSDPMILDDSQMLSPSITKPHYARSEQRTITIKNLSDRATHQDIVDIIRGGPLLDVFLRPHDKMASVSFVEGAAAAAFLNHVRRNDIYVHGKRLEFGWNDRQFILPGHVAGKIHTGATRNLVLRGINSTITADRLREDLDHIHNLVIIDIHFDKGDAFISLNSIHNSLFARTCMMSRAAYKGMRIEWYPDECAQALPKTPSIPKKTVKPAGTKKPPNVLNRFQMLNMDGSAEDSSTEGDDGLSDLSTIHHSKNWNAEGVAV